QHDVDVERIHHVDRLLGRASLTGHREPGLGLQQRAQPGAHHRVVVRDQYPDHRPPPHGSVTATAVPPPGVDSTTSVPFSSAALARMVARPKPRSGPGGGGDAGSKPTPSSTTSSATSVSM